DRVREVLARTKTTFTIDGKDHTPAQLLERLGFAREHLSARVGELSGGQKRRLQLLLLLLAEPNVIALDEPTNDVDSDMLAAMEDLLDSWPGTLIVISHDRYLLERITDQQYAILDGRLRHVPGGVDEYLRLRAAQGSTGGPSAMAAATSTTAKGGAQPPSSSTPAGDPAAQRETRKRMARIEKQLAKLDARENTLHHEMADAVHDHTRLAELNATLGAIRDEKELLELEWLEAAELVG
ncbi:MAG: ATP-binding cassette domain-containing protein, partial [Janibacter sp.]|nr:ATP-binding cassette domain-containing protein [Janibacter sp.]